MYSPTCLLPSRLEPTEKKYTLRTKYTNLLATDNKARFTLPPTLPVAMALISSTEKEVHPLWAVNYKRNSDSKQLQAWNVCATHSKRALVVKTQTMATETENYNREVSEAIWTLYTRTQFITAIFNVLKTWLSTSPWRKTLRRPFHYFPQTRTISKTFNNFTHITTEKNTSKWH